MLFLGVLLLSGVIGAYGECNQTRYLEYESQLDYCVINTTIVQKCDCWETWKICVTQIDCYGPKNKQRLYDNCIALDCPPDVLACGGDESSASTIISSTVVIVLVIAFALTMFLCTAIIYLYKVERQSSA